MIEVCSNVRHILLVFGMAAPVCVPVAPALGQRPAALGSALDLRTVLDSVIATHPTIRAARARLGATEGSRQTAGQYANPVLAFGIDNTAFPGGQTLQGIDREVMTTLTVPLEPLYQRGPRVRQATAHVRAAAADAQAMAQAVALDASRAFYRVARAEVRVESTRDVASWLDSVVSYNRARVNEGVAAEADLIRAQLERDRAVAEVSAQEAELVRASGTRGVRRTNSIGRTIASQVRADCSPDSLGVRERGPTRERVRRCIRRCDWAGAPHPP